MSLQLDIDILWSKNADELFNLGLRLFDSAAL